MLLLIGELATILERRLKVRRLDCPRIFHRDATPLRKPWERACAALGLTGRIVYDLRRSGVHHFIRASAPPHPVMAFSGHRTPSTLSRASPSPSGLLGCRTRRNEAAPATYPQPPGVSAFQRVGTFSVSAEVSGPRRRGGGRLPRVPCCRNGPKWTICLEH